MKWLIRLLFGEKKDDRLNLPIYHEEKYDTLYNSPDGCKKHDWYFFSSEIDLTPTPFANLGIIKTNNRICEKCFLWESKIREEGFDWDFQGFAKRAYDKLIEQKIESIIV